MGERERVGGRDGLLATQMISLSSLSFSFSRCVCAYISERERERRRRQRETEREGDRCEEAIFYLDFCPADSLKIYFSLASFVNFFVFLFFSSTPSFLLPPKKSTEKKRRGGGGGLSTFFSLSFLRVCEIKNLSSVSSYHYYYGYKILLQQC